jgi:carbon monoxide dehydrogenase subunit G
MENSTQPRKRSLLSKIVIGFIVFIAFIMSIGIFLPEEYGMERSIVINAPAEKVFMAVNDLKNWEKWSPWQNQDPTSKMFYGENTIGKDAYYNWKGEKTGEGRMTILESSENRLVKTKVEFTGSGYGFADFHFENQGNGVKVTWSFNGKAEGYADKYFGAMIDKFLGPDYEKGLELLKKYAENN